jgi:hypothetical protein
VEVGLAGRPHVRAPGEQQRVMISEDARCRGAVSTRSLAEMFILFVVRRRWKWRNDFEQVDVGAVPCSRARTPQP